MEEIKITGTKGYVQIEDNGNIARFNGELCDDGFYAKADSIQWVRHKGVAADKDRIDLICKVTKYVKGHDFKVLFYDENNNLLFENMLGLKTEVREERP